MFEFIKIIKTIVDIFYKIYRMIYGGMKFISLLLQILFYVLIIIGFVLLYQSGILQELYQAFKSLPI